MLTYLRTLRIIVKIRKLINRYVFASLEIIFVTMQNYVHIKYIITKTNINLK